MDKSNLELFQQAINEGLSNKFDKMADECSEEIVYSDRHRLAMQTIIYGKANTNRTLSSKMKRVIAILVAAALLLTSCGIIFRNEIREIFKDFFVSLTYEANDESDGIVLEEVYTLRYLPEGYTLEKEDISNTLVRYQWINSIGDILYFEQRPLTRSDFIVDSESGYSQIKEIEEYDVYCRFNDKYFLYIYSDDKYLINIKSSVYFSNEEIILILDGITTK